MNMTLTLAGIRLCTALGSLDFDTCEERIYDLANTTVRLYNQPAFVTFAPAEFTVPKSMECVAWAYYEMASIRATSYFCWKDGPMKFNLNKGRFE